MYIIMYLISDNSEYMLEEIKRQPATIDRFYGRHLYVYVSVVEFNPLVNVIYLTFWWLMLVFTLLLNI